MTPTFRQGRLVNVQITADCWSDIQGEMATCFQVPVRSSSKVPGADVVFCCLGGSKLQAHLPVLSTRTGFVKAQLGSLNLNQHYDHLNQLTVVMPDVCHDILKHCLEVIYTGRTLTFNKNVRDCVKQNMKDLFHIDVGEDVGVAEAQAEGVNDVKKEVEGDEEEAECDGDVGISFKNDMESLDAETLDMIVEEDERYGDEGPETLPIPVDKVRKEPEASSTSLEANATFNSYQDFMDVFEKYCKENYVMWTLGRTRSRNPDEPDYDRFPREMAFFVCQHSGKAKPSTSKGLRKPKKIIERTNCCFYIYTRYLKSSGRLAIRHLNLHHRGHPVGPEFYKKTEKRLKLPMNDRFAEKVKKVPPVPRKRLPCHPRIKRFGLFETLDEFYEVFNVYCETTFVNYKAVVTQDETNSGPQSLVVHCVHQGETPPLGTGCSFVLKLRRTDGGPYCIDHFFKFHSGHKVGKSQYLSVKNILNKGKPHEIRRMLNLEYN